MNITLHQLRAFIAVVQYGGFTRAGEQMCISQPSLTLLIKQLERELGVKLLDRSTRSVELTKAGAELLPVAKGMFSELSLAVQNMRELSTVRRGRVVIGALPSASASLIPHALYEFGLAHPGVQVTLHDGIATKLIEMVRVGEIDFSVSSYTSVAPDLSLAPIMRDRMYLICRDDHPLSPLKEVHWHSVLAYPFIAMNHGTSVRHATDSAFAKIGVVKVPEYEVTLLSTMFSLAKAGVGVTALPTLVLKAFNIQGVAKIPLASPVVEREIGFIFRRDRSLSPAATSLMPFITAAAKTGLLHQFESS